MLINIVGGGLAGTAIAKLCYENNISFDWHIDSKPNASDISSGIINPITGKNLVLTWLFESFLKSALAFYHSDHTRFIEPIHIEKHIQDEILFKDICLDINDRSPWMDIVSENIVALKHCYQVKVQYFMEYWKSKLDAHILHEPFEYENITLQETHSIYKDKSYNYIIFCEGISVRNNPFFNHLPFSPNRGEALEIDIPNYDLTKIVHKGKMLCPYKNHYWVGSSFDRVPYESPLKTEKVYSELTDYLEQNFSHVPYEIKQHLGAMRCTARDRKPIIDRHLTHRNLFVFNGFGTKGASLIPYFAQNLISHIKNDTPLDHEVSFKRFKEYR